MARIRSIKPEFPHSETVGRLSRHARLLFIQLWTIVDDAGRARAASRMLASLLYPYDDDAPTLIEGWLGELEREGCVRRYEVNGTKYLDLPNWLKHQKIDKPSQSKIPAFVECSPNPREPSRTLAPDLGPRILDLGKDHSEPNGSAAEAARPDFRKELFDRGLKAVVAKSGMAEATARAFLGKALAKAGDEAVLVLAAIDETIEADPVDFKGRFMAGLSRNQARAPPKSEKYWM